MEVAGEMGGLMNSHRRIRRQFSKKGQIITCGVGGKQLLMKYREPFNKKKKVAFIVFDLTIVALRGRNHNQI